MNSLALALTFAISFVQALPQVKVSEQRATKIATAKYRDTLIAKTILEHEDGKWEYSVLIRSKGKLREIIVDAMTGKITEAEVLPPNEVKEKLASRGPKKAGG